ncbi:hypothetical protein ACRE_011850 [Hapsidospora chrysogenum ATCC 11550]|uniref:Uncharacterized protein n=1 Tax=Hapsidospora chrysogenum (strain ATCC 11550 / CBS 779.69 / DSM 880 / IAM 14645 / JCM 23072 / IMI 49137) TaxID=857340 RepID=A0A086TF33_HAPC1|nr:hypothetical protein ACRE_011850 [Hapsidospora chrysogenum ATCC 11550]
MENHEPMPCLPKEPPFPGFNGVTELDLETYIKLQELWNNIKDTLDDEEKVTFCELVTMSDRRGTTKKCSFHRINRRANNRELFNRAYYLVLKEMFGIEECMQQPWWSTFEGRHPDEAAFDKAEVEATTATPVTPRKPLPRSRGKRPYVRASRRTCSPPMTPSPSPRKTSPRSLSSPRSIVIRRTMGGYNGQSSGESDSEVHRLRARALELEQERDQKEGQIQTLEAELYWMGGRIRELETLLGGMKQVTAGFSQILAQVPSRPGGS